MAAVGVVFAVVGGSQRVIRSSRAADGEVAVTELVPDKLISATHCSHAGESTAPAECRRHEHGDAAFGLFAQVLVFRGAKDAVNKMLL